MTHDTSSKTCLLAITGAFDTGGGIAAVNRSIIQTLSEANYEIWVLALNEPHRSKSHYVQFPNVHFEGMAGNKLKFGLAMWREALIQRPHLIMFDHVNVAFTAAPLALLRMVRYSVFLHGVEVYAPSPTFEGKLGLYCAQKRIANSEYTAQQVRKQFPTLSVTLCELGLGADQSKPITDEPAETEPLLLTAINGEVRKIGQQVVLHVGRMASGEQYKGQDTLIHAMSLVLAECAEAQLVLVGDGSDFERLRHLACAQSPQVQLAIFMPGQVSDEARNLLYRQCALFAMPSWGEGFGLVYIEAMQWTKPCIGSRSGVARTIIRDGETGMLVDDPKNASELADKVIHLLTHPAIARAMGQAGYQRIQDFYLFSHFKQRFLKAVES